MSENNDAPKLPNGYFRMAGLRPKPSVQERISVLLDACAECGRFDADIEPEWIKEIYRLQFTKVSDKDTQKKGKESKKHDRFVKELPDSRVINDILGRSGMDADKFKRSFEKCYGRWRRANRRKKPQGIIEFKHGKTTDRSIAEIASRIESGVSGVDVKEEIEKYTALIAFDAHSGESDKPAWMNRHMIEFYQKKITKEMYCKLVDCSLSTFYVHEKKFFDHYMDLIFED